MRNIIFLCTILLISPLGASAQDTLYINRQNGISSTIPVNEIDSITFSEPAGYRITAIADTITDTLIVREVHQDTLYSNIPTSVFYGKKLVTIGDEITLCGGWQEYLVTNAALVWSADETAVGVGETPPMAVEGSIVMPADENSIYIRALMAHLYHPDIILLYGGENDLYIGDYATGEVDSLRLGSANDVPFITQQPTLGDTVSFCSAYMGMLQQLIALNPLARIFVVAPMPIYINPDSCSVQPCERVRFAKWQAIVDMAGKYKLPVIDLWGTAGVGDYNAFAMYDATAATKMQTVPNASGSRRVAEAILTAWQSYSIDHALIKKIPCDIIANNKDVEELMRTMSASYYDSDGDSVIDRFTFLHASDIHGYLPAAQHITDYCAAYPGIIDAALFSGDFISWDYSIDDGSPLLKLLSGMHQPMELTMGNHDAGYSFLPSLSGTNSQVYNKLLLPIEEKLSSRSTDYVRTQDSCTIEDKSYYTDSMGTESCAWSAQAYEKSIYYYRDYSDKRLRVISLYDYDDANDTVWGAVATSTMVDTLLQTDTVFGTLYRIERGSHVYRKQQMEWLARTLQSVPDRYGVIILKHEEPMDIDTLPLIDFVTPATANYYTPAYSYTRSTSLMTGHVVPAMVDAWLNKRRLSQAFAYKDNAAYMDTLRIEADFSGGAGEREFICYLCGHDHVDGIFRLNGFDGQLLLMVTTARYTHGKRDILPRNVDTKSEDAFNIVSIDRKKRQLYITRIGSNLTNDYTDRSCTIVHY